MCQPSKLDSSVRTWVLAQKKIMFVQGMYVQGMGIYHIWVGKIGYVWSTEKKCPVKDDIKMGMKYMGYTSDVGWPKKMNTGRLLYKTTDKVRRKQKAKFKKLS